MQACHLHAQLADESHVVLDDDNGVRPGDVAQKMGCVFGFRVCHSGDRFIDKQEFRVLRQQHCNFEPLLLPVAEIAGETVAQIDKANALQAPA